MAERLERAQSFSSPEEEIVYLREQVAKKERELLNRNREIDHFDYESLAKEEIREYGEHEPTQVLHKDHQIKGHKLSSALEHVETAKSKVEEVVSIAREEGIRNALTVLEKLDNAYLTDEVHRVLVQEIRVGTHMAHEREHGPLFKALHMTLFSVVLPDAKKEQKAERPLRELLASMEQFYAGMQSVGNEDTRSPNHFTLEIADSNNSDHIIFYAAVPDTHADLFEKHVHSLYPHAVITEEKNDYNIFVEGGTSLMSVATLKRHPVYPLKSYDTFEHDPINVLLNSLSKIEREGGGAAIQVLIKPVGQKYHGDYEGIIKRILKGTEVAKAIRMSTMKGEVFELLKETVSQKKKDDEFDKKSEPHQEEVEQFQEKISSTIAECNIQLVVSSQNHLRAEQILKELESGFNQFDNPSGNQVVFKRFTGSKLKKGLKQFTFREFTKARMLPLSFKELTGMAHFPPSGIESSPQFMQSRAKQTAAPLNLPEEGTLLGVNEYRDIDTKVHVTPEDRLRHLYLIGQTGTGKTTLMKNVIMQDIEAGHGVCMIDPHGTDIMDVLASIPKEREEDVIYFDPAYDERVLGLNMLEFDPQYPEQKTFVVNELFSIFQKLYGAVPESMGPMFEQYFRNATMLVLEDQESGSTLLDVSRVMADPEYRRLKLSKASNPVVVQFWKEIATRAGGEAALENIVPYVTSKFDIFTANDYMRPTIGQQKSSFNFREVMDEGKILLVNLSKGRIGEINANLIGMIIVGKILMAALSRVDSDVKTLKPFYLHIDEFQNVTTDSIASILSEARKYRLGLTLAHQYIQQIDEKIRDAVFGNVGSLVSFRVGPDDAEYLEKQFEPEFSANDLLNIENHRAYIRILANGTPTKPFSINTMPPKASERSDAIRIMKSSYEQYGEYKKKVDMEITARYQRF